MVTDRELVNIEQECPIYKCLNSSFRAEVLIVLSPSIFFMIITIHKLTRRTVVLLSMNNHKKEDMDEKSMKKIRSSS